MQPCETSESGESGGGSSGPRGDPVILRPAELESVPMCRICFNGPKKERLLKPCRCKGSIKYVHRRCLEQWLAVNNNESCEICKYHFQTTRTRMTCWEWLKTWKGTRERRAMVYDFFFSLVITLFGAGLLWLCVEGAMYYYRLKQFNQSAALVKVAIAQIVVNIVWTVVFVKFNKSTWASWREHRWLVRVMDREGTSTPSSSCSSAASLASTATSFLEPRLQPSQRVDQNLRVHQMVTAV